MLNFEEIIANLEKCDFRITEMNEADADKVKGKFKKKKNRRKLPKY